MTALCAACAHAVTGGFRVVEYALQRLRGVDDGWNSFLAGTTAGSKALISFSHAYARVWMILHVCGWVCTGLSIAIDTKSRQKAVSLYVFFKCVPLVPLCCDTTAMSALIACTRRACGMVWSSLTTRGLLPCGGTILCTFSENSLSHASRG
jgi:hypothetical protein